ncbi:MAG: phosphoribosylamine--glycine ligase [Acidobacteriota bacterium]
MKVLVLGSGGREHALAWRLNRDPDVTEVIAAPGNPGIAGVARCFPVELDRTRDLLDLAIREHVDLTVVGPEAPLERGLADLFRSEGRAILGPSSRGAALECSKAYSKHFMARHGIPTARFVVCDDAPSALETIASGEFGFPVVIKADGLAAGKGVVIALDRAEADQAIRAAMVDGQFGAAGSRLVIEECLSGPEVSFFVVCDGTRAAMLSNAQDHKRIWDDDRGPNTGGMGAFAPSPLVSADVAAFAMRQVVEKVLDGMREDGDPYNGFLYVSLMLTPAGPKVIEFNVRFGDPEAQVVLPSLKGRLAECLMQAATGRLTDVPLVTPGPARFVGVVLASRGYPATSESGRVITGLESAAATQDALVFHAGTRADGAQIVTAGGRVLTVVGRGATYDLAMQTAYRAAGAIHFDGMQFRRDIGRKAVPAPHR